MISHETLLKAFPNNAIVLNDQKTIAVVVGECIINKKPKPTLLHYVGNSLNNEFPALFEQGANKIGFRKTKKGNWIK